MFKPWHNCPSPLGLSLRPLASILTTENLSYRHCAIRSKIACVSTWLVVCLCFASWGSKIVPLLLVRYFDFSIFPFIGIILTLKTPQSRRAWKRNFCCNSVRNCGYNLNWNENLQCCYECDITTTIQINMQITWAICILIELHVQLRAPPLMIRGRRKSKKKKNFKGPSPGKKKIQEAFLVKKK